MTSYEIVRRAIEFERPERIPIRMGAFGIDDTHGVGVERPAGWTPREPGEDPWGCVWHKPPEDSGIVNMGRPVVHPLTCLERMDEQVAWPDPHDDSRYANIEAGLAKAGEKYVLSGAAFVFFERMHFLRGMEQLFIDMYERPKLVHELAERVVEHPIQIARELGRRFGGRIHGFVMTDDWGTQQTAFIRVPMWREFFKDRYRRLFDAIHEAGMHAWMHSCGRINDIVEEWIDCGLDVVELLQPRSLGIEEMGRRFRGHICFQSLCDIQTTLPQGDDDAIREEAALLLEHWSTPEGGFILCDYGDDAAIGTQPGKKRVMFDAFVRLGAPGLVA